MTPGLFVKISGPGVLRISETMLGTYELRAGRIRAIDPFNLAPPVDEWLRQHADGVLALGGLNEAADNSLNRHSAYIFDPSTLVTRY